ncbi:MAG: hypothetical protein V4694_07310 [Pseudomonadota bacterium]
MTKITFAKTSATKRATFKNAREVFHEELSQSKKVHQLYLKTALED